MRRPDRAEPADRAAASDRNRAGSRLEFTMGHMALGTTGGVVAECGQP